MNRLILMAILALAISTIHIAKAQEISGAWSFRTDIEHKGCTITGTMRISGADAAGQRTCQFVSNETCEYDPERFWRVDQICQITPQKDHYLIKSEVVGSLTEGYSISNYLADHFIIQRQSSEQMSGLWQDANYSAPVTFWRDDALPVS